MGALLVSTDTLIFSIINGFAGRNEIVDSAVVFISYNYLLKGVPVAMIIWGLWFTTNRQDTKNRSRILALLVVSIVAIFAGRLLAQLLPFRLRPMHDPTVSNVLPFGVSEAMLDGWNSMPSDHAVMFFALAAGITMLHRVWGIFALIHAVIIISLPRIYLGYHFPLDLVVGAFIGVLCALLVIPPLARIFVRSNTPRRLLSYPSMFYPAFFLTTFQLSSMFDSARELLRVISSFLSVVAG